jgi:hypothetical protein
MKVSRRNTLNHRGRLYDETIECARARRLFPDQGADGCLDSKFFCVKLELTPRRRFEALKALRRNHRGGRRTIVECASAYP